MNIITDKLPSEIHNKWLGIDIEMFDLNEKRMHRPTSGKFALMSIADGEDVYIINDETKIAPALDLIKDNWWIFHHAKFDLTHLRRWANIPPRKRLWDTMLMERILFGGYYDSFALNDLARRHLFIHMEKELQKSFIGSEITAEQIQYSAMDAYVLPKIVKEQKKLTTKDDFNVWMNIDRPALFAFMDFQGFAINVTEWQELATKNKLRQEQIDEQLPINPRSHKQVVEYLGKNGFKGISNSQEETLIKFFQKYPETTAADVANMVLQSRMYGKRASTYGMNFIEDYLEQDNGTDMIYADYWVTGAETGRTSCSSPAMQTIIARDTKDFRHCFITRPGHKLLIADYSAQEPFISAYLSQDPNLINVCNSGKDIYILMAKMMYGVDIDKKDPMRASMKAVVLGGNYGQSVNGLARKEGISVAEAEEMIAKRRKAFPVYDEYMREQTNARNFVKTVAGRTVHLNHHGGQAERNALNAPIQGSAGDCMKQALGNFHKAWMDYHNGMSGYSFPMVGYIHDELVADVPTEIASFAGEFMRRTMIETANNMFPGMNFRADVSMGDTWADK